MDFGGPRSLIEEVKRVGGRPGPMSMWVTGGALKWGTGNIDTHYAACKQLGVTPLVKFWYWGDDISTHAIINGVRDRYQGTWKTRAAGIDLARQIGAKAKAAGVSPIVAIEHEFAQGGLETDRSAFAPYWLEVASTIKRECPSARIVFTLPIWEDEAALAKVYPDLIKAADLIGSQTLLFPPRHGSKEFTNAGPNLVAAFNAFRTAAAGKPACVVDLGFSSYGGPYSTSHPFDGGNGQANEWLQDAALKSVRSSLAQMNLEFIVYRDLRDAPNFDVNNYGGYAERHVGLIDSTGRKKPAYTTAMEMAKLAPAPAPAPAPTYTQTQWDEQQALLTAEKSRAEKLTLVVGELTEQVKAKTSTLAQIHQLSTP